MEDTMIHHLKKIRLIPVFTALMVVLSAISLNAYPAMEPGKWASEWAASKTAFETTTGKKKPSELILGKFRKSSGIEDALKKLDSEFDKFQKSKPNSSDADLKKLQAASEAFIAVKSTYMTTLQKAVDEDKTEDPIYELCVNILRLDLEAIEGQSTAMIRMEGMMLAKMDKTEMLKTISMPMLKATLKKGELFIARLTVDKSVDEFNKGNLTMARDITQNLTNIKKRGWYVLPPNVDSARAVLENYGNAAPSIRAADVTDLNTKLDALSSAITTVKTWVNGQQ